MEVVRVQELRVRWTVIQGSSTSRVPCKNSGAQTSTRCSARVEIVEKLGTLTLLLSSFRYRRSSGDLQHDKSPPTVCLRDANVSVDGS